MSDRIDKYRKAIADYEALPDPHLIRCVQPRTRTEYFFPLDRVESIQRDGSKDEFFVRVHGDDRAFYVDRTDGKLLAAWLADVSVQPHYAAKRQADEAAQTIEILSRADATS